MEDIEYLEEYEDLVLPALNSAAAAEATSSTSVTTKSNKNSQNRKASDDGDDSSSSLDQDIFNCLFDDNSDDDEDFNEQEQRGVIKQKSQLHECFNSLNDKVGGIGEKLVQKVEISRQDSTAKFNTFTKATNKINSSTPRPKSYMTKPTGTTIPITAVSRPQSSVTTKPKSIATVRPTVQNQRQQTKQQNIPQRKANTIQRPTTSQSSSFNQRSKPSNFTTTPTFSKSVQLPALARKPLSSTASTSSSTFVTKKPPTLSLPNLKSAPEYKKVIKRPATIVRPEKIITKDPINDPLDLDDISEAGSENYSLSDISGETYNSVSDFDDDSNDEFYSGDDDYYDDDDEDDISSSSQIIEISNDSSGAHSNLEDLRASTPSPVISDDSDTPSSSSNLKLEKSLSIKPYRHPDIVESILRKGEKPSLYDLLDKHNLIDDSLDCEETDEDNDIIDITASSENIMDTSNSRPQVSTTSSYAALLAAAPVRPVRRNDNIPHKIPHKHSHDLNKKKPKEKHVKNIDYAHDFRDRKSPGAESADSDLSAVEELLEESYAEAMKKMKNVVMTNQEVGAEMEIGGEEEVVTNEVQQQEENTPIIPKPGVVTDYDDNLFEDKLPEKIEQTDTGQKASVKEDVTKNKDEIDQNILESQIKETEETSTKSEVELQNLEKTETLAENKSTANATILQDTIKANISASPNTKKKKRFRNLLTPDPTEEESANLVKSIDDVNDFKGFEETANPDEKDQNTKIKQQETKTIEESLEAVKTTAEKCFPTESFKSPTSSHKSLKDKSKEAIDIDISKDIFKDSKDKISRDASRDSKDKSPRDTSKGSKDRISKDPSSKSSSGQSRDKRSRESSKDRSRESSKDRSKHSYSGDSKKSHNKDSSRKHHHHKDHRRSTDSKGSSISRESSKSRDSKSKDSHKSSCDKKDLSSSSSLEGVKEKSSEIKETKTLIESEKPHNDLAKVPTDVKTKADNKKDIKDDKKSLENKDKKQTEKSKEPQKSFSSSVSSASKTNTPSSRDSSKDCKTVNKQSVPSKTSDSVIKKSESVTEKSKVSIDLDTSLKSNTVSSASKTNTPSSRDSSKDRKTVNKQSVPSKTNDSVIKKSETVTEKSKVSIDLNTSLKSNTVSSASKTNTPSSRDSSKDRKTVNKQSVPSKTSDSIIKKSESVTEKSKVSIDLDTSLKSNTEKNKPISSSATDKVDFSKSNEQTKRLQNNKEVQQKLLGSCKDIKSKDSTKDFKTDNPSSKATPVKQTQQKTNISISSSATEKVEFKKSNEQTKKLKDSKEVQQKSLDSCKDIKFKDATKAFEADNPSSKATPVKQTQQETTISKNPEINTPKFSSKSNRSDEKRTEKVVSSDCQKTINIGDQNKKSDTAEDKEKKETNKTSAEKDYSGKTNKQIPIKVDSKNILSSCARQGNSKDISTSSSIVKDQKTKTELEKTADNNSEETSLASKKPVQISKSNIAIEKVKASETNKKDVKKYEAILTKGKETSKNKEKSNVTKPEGSLGKPIDKALKEITKDKIDSKEISLKSENELQKEIVAKSKSDINENAKESKEGSTKVDEVSSSDKIDENKPVINEDQTKKEASKTTIEKSCDKDTITLESVKDNPSKANTELNITNAESANVLQTPIQVNVNKVEVDESKNQADLKNVTDTNNKLSETFSEDKKIEKLDIPEETNKEPNIKELENQEDTVTDSPKIKDAEKLDESDKEDNKKEPVGVDKAQPIKIRKSKVVLDIINFKRTKLNEIKPKPEESNKYTKEKEELTKGNNTPMNLYSSNAEELNPKEANTEELKDKSSSKLMSKTREEITSNAEDNTMDKNEEDVKTEIKSRETRSRIEITKGIKNSPSADISADESSKILSKTKDTKRSVKTSKVIDEKQNKESKLEETTLDSMEIGTTSEIILISELNKSIDNENSLAESVKNPMEEPQDSIKSRSDVKVEGEAEKIKPLLQSIDQKSLKEDNSTTLSDEHVEARNTRSQSDVSYYIEKDETKEEFSKAKIIREDTSTSVTEETPSDKVAEVSRTRNPGDVGCDIEKDKKQETRNDKTIIQSSKDKTDKITTSSIEEHVRTRATRSREDLKGDAENNKTQEGSSETKTAPVEEENVIPRKTRNNKDKEAIEKVPFESKEHILTEIDSEIQSEHFEPRKTRQRDLKERTQEVSSQEKPSIEEDSTIQTENKQIQPRKTRLRDLKTDVEIESSLQQDTIKQTEPEPIETPRKTRSRASAKLETEKELSLEEFSGKIVLAPVDIQSSVEDEQNQMSEEHVEPRKTRSRLDNKIEIPKTPIQNLKAMPKEKCPTPVNLQENIEDSHIEPIKTRKVTELRADETSDECHSSNQKEKSNTPKRLRVRSKIQASIETRKQTELQEESSKEQTEPLHKSLAKQTTVNPSVVTTFETRITRKRAELKEETLKESAEISPTESLNIKPTIIGKHAVNEETSKESTKIEEFSKEKSLSELNTTNSMNKLEEVSLIEQAELSSGGSPVVKSNAEKPSIETRQTRKRGELKEDASKESTEISLEELSTENSTDLQKRVELQEDISKITTEISPSKSCDQKSFIELTNEDTMKKHIEQPKKRKGRFFKPHKSVNTSIHDESLGEKSSVHVDFQYHTEGEGHIEPRKTRNRTTALETDGEEEPKEQRISRIRTTPSESKGEHEEPVEPRKTRNRMLALETDDECLEPKKIKKNEATSENPPSTHQDSGELIIVSHEKLVKETEKEITELTQVESSADAENKMEEKQKPDSSKCSIKVDSTKITQVEDITSSTTDEAQVKEDIKPQEASNDNIPKYELENVNEQIPKESIRYSQENLCIDADISGSESSSSLNDSIIERKLRKRTTDSPLSENDKKKKVFKEPPAKSPAFGGTPKNIGKFEKPTTQLANTVKRVVRSPALDNECPAKKAKLDSSRKLTRFRNLHDDCLDEEELPVVTAAVGLPSNDPEKSGTLSVPDLKQSFSKTSETLQKENNDKTTDPLKITSTAKEDQIDSKTKDAENTSKPSVKVLQKEVLDPKENKKETKINVNIKKNLPLDETKTKADKTENISTAVTQADKTENISTAVTQQTPDRLKTTKANVNISPTKSDKCTSVISFSDWLKTKKQCSAAAATLTDISSKKTESQVPVSTISKPTIEKSSDDSKINTKGKTKLIEKELEPSKSGTEVSLEKSFGQDSAKTVAKNTLDVKNPNKEEPKLINSEKSASQALSSTQTKLSTEKLIDINKPNSKGKAKLISKKLESTKSDADESSEKGASSVTVKSTAEVNKSNIKIRTRLEPEAETKETTIKTPQNISLEEGIIFQSKGKDIALVNKKDLILEESKESTAEDTLESMDSSKMQNYSLLEPSENQLENALKQQPRKSGGRKRKVKRLNSPARTASSSTTSPKIKNKKSELDLLMESMSKEMKEGGIKDLLNTEKHVKRQRIPTKKIANDDKEQVTTTKINASTTVTPTITGIETPVNLPSAKLDSEIPKVVDYSDNNEILTTSRNASKAPLENIKSSIISRPSKISTKSKKPSANTSKDTAQSLGVTNSELQTPVLLPENPKTLAVKSRKSLNIKEMPQPNTGKEKTKSRKSMPLLAKESNMGQKTFGFRLPTNVKSRKSLVTSNTTATTDEIKNTPSENVFKTPKTPAPSSILNRIPNAESISKLYPGASSKQAVGASIFKVNQSLNRLKTFKCRRFSIRLNRSVVRRYWNTINNFPKQTLTIDSGPQKQTVNLEPVIQNNSTASLRIQAVVDGRGVLNATPPTDNLGTPILQSILTPSQNAVHQTSTIPIPSLQSSFTLSNSIETLNPLLTSTSLANATDVNETIELKNEFLDENPIGIINDAILPDTPTLLARAQSVTQAAQHALSTSITPTDIRLLSTDSALNQCSVPSFGVTPTALDNRGTCMYTFLHPAKYNRNHSNVLLDYCCPNLNGPMPAIDPTRIHAQVQVPVIELPASIVLTTKVVTRADLENGSASIPAIIRKKAEKIRKNLATHHKIAVSTTAPLIQTPTVSAIMSQPEPRPVLPPTINDLRKQLPATTTITPKIRPAVQPHPPTAAITPSAGGPTINRNNIISVMPKSKVSQISSVQSSSLRSNLRRFDVLLKQLVQPFDGLDFVERHRVIENLIATGKFDSKDLDKSLLLMEEYVKQTLLVSNGSVNTPPPSSSTAILNTNEYVAPQTAVSSPLPPPSGMPQLQPSPTILASAAASSAASPSYTRQMGQIHSKAVRKVQSRTRNTSTTSSPIEGASSSMVVKQRQVPIYDTDRNIIGYQMQMMNQMSTIPAYTKSTMSTHTGAIMSTTSLNSSSNKITSYSLSKRPIKRPAQDSPRVFYTTPPLKTSTPKGLTNPHLYPAQHTANTNALAQKRQGSIVTTLRSGGSSSSGSSETITTTTMATVKRVTRSTATGSKIIIVSKSNQSSEETILPDEHQNQHHQQAEIKNETDEDFLLG